MPHVLIVHDSESVRTDLAHELLAEGFTVAEAESALHAVRAIWEENFVAVLFGGAEASAARSFEENLRTIAPEIISLPIGREKPRKLARKLAEILDGAAAA